MMNCHPSLLLSGDQTISWIAENLRHPWLTPLMETLTHLGTISAVLFMMSFGYWCWNKTHSKTIMYGVLLSGLTNFWLKEIFMECRPPIHLHLQKISGLSYSFPSGHAQASIVMWAGLAYYVRSKILSGLFILVGLLIAFSRNYLGVHYVHDVIAGTLIGLVILMLCIFNEKKNITQRLPIWLQFIILIAFLGLCFFNIHSQTHYLMIAMGLFLGIWLGSIFEEKRILFTPSCTFHNLLCYGIIGFGGVFLIIFTQYYFIPVFFQYMFVGMWLMAGAPWITNTCYVRFSL